MPSASACLTLRFNSMTRGWQIVLAFLDEDGRAMQVALPGG